MTTVQTRPAGFSYKCDVIGKPDKQTPEGAKLYIKLGKGWTKAPEARPDQLLQMVQRGWAVAPGIYTYGHKEDDSFEVGQYVFLDYDNTGMTWEEAKADPWFNQHCLFGYTSPSHGLPGKGERFRIVGLMEKPVRTVVGYNGYCKALRNLIPGQDASMGASQASFGNANGEFHVFNFDNVLPHLEPVKFERKPVDPLLKLILNGEDLPQRKEKAKLCLAVIPPRGAAGGGTYPAAFAALTSLVNEFGADEAITLINECNWYDPECGSDWDVERKAYSLEDDNKPEDRQRKLGSLVKQARDLLFGEELEAFNSKLDAINRTNKTVQSAAQHTTNKDSTSKAEEISAIINKLVELELDIDNNNWAEQQALIKEACTLVPSKTDVNNRVFDHICDYLGVDLGSTKGNQIKSQGMDRLRKLRFAKQDPWLVDRYLQHNRDAILFGDSGSGKTSISLDMIRCLIEGSTFADGRQASHTDKKVLFIASDGGSTAEEILSEYLENMNLFTSPAFDNQFEYWAAQNDSSAPPWNLKTGNLIKLRDTVATGEYALVVIDSLKAVCAQTQYSIDDRNISNIMRLVQAVVCPHASLLWIHHTNKSGSSSSHSAGGATDIIEVVSAAFQAKRVWNQDNTVQTNTMVIHKLRGCDTRTFDYEFTFDEGLIPEQQFTVEARKINDRKTSYPEVIMVALRDHKYGRMGRSSLAERFGVTPNTLDPYLTELKNDGLIRSQQGKYTLTTKGNQVAGEFTRKKYEEACSKDDALDF